MPKINVYLPDELADAVRETGLPVSPICQRALEHAVRRITTIRQAVLSDLDPDRLSERLPSFTGRLIITLTLAARRAQEAGAATVTTADLLHGLLAENHNLGVQILTAMDVAPDSLTAPSTPEPDSGGSGLRFSAPAAVALELAVGEAIGFGHNYVGCEHCSSVWPPNRTAQPASSCAPGPSTAKPPAERWPPPSPATPTCAPPPPTSRPPQQPCSPPSEPS